MSAPVSPNDDAFAQEDNNPEKHEQEEQNEDTNDKEDNETEDIDDEQEKQEFTERCIREDLIPEASAMCVATQVEGPHPGLKAMDTMEALTAKHTSQCGYDEEALTLCFYRVSGHHFSH
ncbi:hypothetical protein EMCG_03811 [[Emmonsia] crescens]|uniref:Uncharacterized protein n=1 Tax=[Emmonsia] crescens TaxID=73230 RepID=A0A0G2J859_9EURO|nr:hypothetical protein EMCG_03811 [Emmonsia crescens UAMH 3008]